MNSLYNPFSTFESRIGFHYYPDTLHYRDADMIKWLPELKSMRVGWLLIKSSANRAIPEAFIRGLIQEHIEPVVQFDLSLNNNPNPGEITSLLESYARWGVKGSLFFDRPNSRSAWSPEIWSQSNLVEQFLDRYLPLAQAAEQVGIASIFPPLQPSGAYWDTAFLAAVLEGMQRRQQAALLEHLVLSCYAWTHQKPLDWGSGGPDRWSSARPYFTPQDSQDHNGFRIYEWYQAAARSIVKTEVPVLLLQAGTCSDPLTRAATTPPHVTGDLQSIASLLYGEPAALPTDETVNLAELPGSVLAGFFYLLASDAGTPESAHAWFRHDGAECSAVETLKNLASLPRLSAGREQAEPADPLHPIDHYLLLPSFDWGVADWHLEVARPLLKKYRPTMGFSIREAALAREVTVIGSESAFPEDLLNQLRLSGSLVRRIDAIGIEIASEVAER